MQFYNQTDKCEVEKAKAQLIKDGHNVLVTHRKATLTRKKNKYNKYMEWELFERSENGSTFTNWFKSKPEAMRYLTRLREPVPIGSDMVISYVELI